MGHAAESLDEDVPLRQARNADSETCIAFCHVCDPLQYKGGAPLNRLKNVA